MTIAYDYKIYRVVGPAAGGVCEQDARWCTLLQCLVRDGGAITLELEERMLATGLDLDRLHRCLQARRKGPPGPP